VHCQDVIRRIGMIVDQTMIKNAPTIVEAGISLHIHQDRQISHPIFLKAEDILHHIGFLVDNCLHQNKNK
jgi:hypothetical protein